MRPRSTSKPTRKIQSSLPVTMATGTSANAQLATQGLLFSPNIFLYQSPKTSHKNSTPSKVELSPLNSKSFTSSPPTFPTQARNLIGCSTGSQTTTSASKLIATNSKPRRQSSSVAISMFVTRRLTSPGPKETKGLQVSLSRRGTASPNF